MLNRLARDPVIGLLTPVAGLLLRLRVGPDAVTVAGTLGVCAGALWFYPRGDFLLGTVVVTPFALADCLDGIMARAAGRSGAWGAFLDSTLDRWGDAAVFGGLVLYFAGPGRDPVLAGLALACLVTAGLVSYVRARAEGLGLRADVGLAERADRLAVVLSAVAAVGLGLPVSWLGVVLALLALACAVTVYQRMAFVRRQLLATAGAGRV
jgi:CDP-diacylglycerol--glycerol-3-phosphate 3-phosphatidyltransferase